MTADINSLSASQQQTVTNKVVDAMAKVAGTTPNQVSTSAVGPTWGGQITDKALEALIIFFIAVVAYISIRFELKMAIAAFVAMLHDLLGDRRGVLTLRSAGDAGHRDRDLDDPRLLAL